MATNPDIVLLWSIVGTGKAYRADNEVDGGSATSDKSSVGTTSTVSAA